MVKDEENQQTRQSKRVGVTNAKRVVYFYLLKLF